MKPDGASNVQRVPVGTEYRDQYMDAAKKVPAARIAGSVMNPLNRIGGGLVSNVVGGAVMEGTEQATGTGDMDAGNIAMSGAVNAAFPKIMQAGGSVLDFAASKMAGPALNLVKDMAEQILQKRASVTG